MLAGDLNQSTEAPLVQEQGQPVGPTRGQSQGSSTVTSTTISSSAGDIP